MGTITDEVKLNKTSVLWVVLYLVILGVLFAGMNSVAYVMVSSEITATYWEAVGPSLALAVPAWLSALGVGLRKNWGRILGILFLLFILLSMVIGTFGHASRAAESFTPDLGITLFLDLAIIVMSIAAVRFLFKNKRTFSSYL